MLEFRF